MTDGDRHRNNHVVGIRGADKALADDARAAAREAGYVDLSNATVSHWKWLTRRPGAEDPRRPDAAIEVAARLLSELEEVIGALYAEDPAEARRAMTDVSCFETDWWGTHSEPRVSLSPTPGSNANIAASPSGRTGRAMHATHSGRSPAHPAATGRAARCPHATAR